MANKEALNAASLRRYHTVVKKDPEKYAAKRDANRRHMTSAQRNAWCKENKHKLNAYHREYYRKHKYGLSNEAYLDLLTRQKNACKICGEMFKSDLNIDHDHATGEIRGLLCNWGLGHFKDNANLLHAAAEYIENAAAKEG